MTTDAWEHVHKALVDWWRHIHPQQADRVDTDLEESRNRALAAREQGPDTDATAELVALWENRLADLLGENHELMAELDRLMEQDVRPHVHNDSGDRHGNQEVHASDNARVYFSGHDLHVHES
ncbi:hypothetical protein ACFZDK_24225 [Streptomyces sp. NPDC007901]|uniref:hypothetical protein n=1 Tax=Streptomyces sp. NPDC007901 TaxID=3364785 RepID=UPI0036F0195C